MPTRRALLGWTSLSRPNTHFWRSVVTHKHRSAAPVREVSSPPVPLPVVWFSPMGQDRLPYTRWGAHVANDPERLPSWAALAHFRVRSGSLGVAGKSNPTKNHAHRFALARAAVRVQRDVDLPRARLPCSHTMAAMRPTDFCHPLSSWTCTRALGFSACLVTRRLERVVRPKGPSFHDALDPLRRAVRQRGRVVTGAFLSRGGYPSEKRRGLAPYTTSPLTPRHPPGHASAFAGQLAWGPVGSRSLSPLPVKRATTHDPRCLPSPCSPRLPAEAPPPCLATATRLSATS